MFRKILLILILLLAFVLRFYRLGDYPALNADEAAIGYNAYSLIETGKDEHGNPWPIHFQSFNDYKPGLYVYQVLPFVKMFGLNEWSVRIPNAFFGVLTVYILYLLIREFKLRTSLEIRNLKLEIEEIAALMLTISPWHIHFSRGGWEVNTATFLITLGILLFIKFVKNSKKFFLLLFNVLSFTLSLYTYHSARIIVPILLFGMLGIYWKEFKSNFKSFLLAGVLGLVFVMPLVKDFLRPEISSRASGVGILADTGPFERVNEQRGEHEDFNGAPAKIIHNKLVNYSLRFLENYSEHFHGLFLFLSGDDIERNKVPETGQMYMLDLLWVVIGLWWLAKNWTKESRVIILWLLVAPIAAALTFQSPHALRAQNMVIPLVIISSLGLAQVVEVIRNMSFIRRIPLYVLLVTLISLSFLRYVHMYYKHMSAEYPFSSQYGVKELVYFLNEQSENFENIVVTTRYDQPYILFLFYNSMLNPINYPPSKFQTNHTLTPRDQYGFSTVSGYNSFIFKEINWDEDKINYPNSLIIGTEEEIPEEANIIKEIYGSNGYKYFVVVAN